MRTLQRFGHHRLEVIANGLRDAGEALHRASRHTRTLLGNRRDLQAVGGATMDSAGYAVSPSHSRTRCVWQTACGVCHTHRVCHHSLCDTA